MDDTDPMWQFPKKKAQGIRRGDFVSIDNTFIGIVKDNFVNRTTRMVDVWGIAHEMGSVYASQLKKISKSEFDARKKELYRMVITQYKQEPQWEESELEKMRR
jgi:hypothetical protein